MYCHQFFSRVLSHLPSRRQSREGAPNRRTLDLAGRISPERKQPRASLTLGAGQRAARASRGCWARALAPRAPSGSCVRSLPRWAADAACLARRCGPWALRAPCGRCTRAPATGPRASRGLGVGALRRAALRISRTATTSSPRRPKLQN